MTPGELPHRDLALGSEDFSNPRDPTSIDWPALIELACDIARNGLYNRIIVRTGGLVLAGQRRCMAIGLLIRWRDHDEIAGQVDTHEIDLFDRRAGELAAAVPVSFDDESDAMGIALADNLHREDLRSYDIAAAVGAMIDAGRSQLSIAKNLNKSPSWVSRHAKAWRNAVPEAKARWQRGEMTLEQVLRLCDLSTADQEQALAGGRLPGARGPANRPGFDAVRDALAELQAKPASTSPYERGLRDALRWVAGEVASIPNGADS